MIFRVDVPALGTVFVESENPGMASAAARQYLIRNRIGLDEGALVGAAVPATADQIGDNLLLNGAGHPFRPAVRETPEFVSDDAGELQTESDVRSRAVEEDSPANRQIVTPSPQQAGSQDSPELLYRFDVPVIGDLFVLASEAEDAISAGQEHVELFRESADLPSDFRLDQPETIEVDDLPASADHNFVIDSTGQVRDDLLTGVAAEPDESESVSSLSTAATAAPFFVGRVVDANGVPGFYRVTSNDTSEARRILESRFGPPARVEVVSSPQFLLETDADFLASVQASQIGDVDAFVQTLELVSAAADGDGSGQLPDADTGNSEPGTVGSGNGLPVDVQRFPFASFQNAVAELGLDPEGALGSTVRRQFDTLAPVRSNRIVDRHNRSDRTVTGVTRGIFPGPVREP